MEDEIDEIAELKIWMRKIVYMEAQTALVWKGASTSVEPPSSI
jgi:hypothetical protein